MIRDPEVLERNLTALLQRAYAPARPSAAFRGRLKAAVLAGVAPGSSMQLVGGGRRRTAVVLLAAAAALIAVSLGWWVGRFGMGHDVTFVGGELLGGRVAMRSEAGGAWRAASAAELRAGLAPAGAYLEVATPSSLVATLVASPDVRVVLDPGTRVVLVSVAGVTELTLASGSAHADTAKGRFDLAIGERYAIVGGSLRRADRAASAPAVGPDDGARERVSPDAPAASQPVAAAELSIRGVVREAVEGAPVAEFRVTWLRVDKEKPEYTQSVSVPFHAADGGFELKHLKPGNYRLVVEAPAFAAWQTTAIQLAPGAADAVQTVLMQRGARVRGLVLEAGTDRPIEGAVVLSESDAPLAYLDSHLAEIPDGMVAGAKTAFDGSFDLAHLSPGGHCLRASAPGFAPAWAPPLTLSAHESREGVVIRLAAGGTIEGRVTRSNGDAWADAEVVALFADRSVERALPTITLARSDASGHYSMPHVPPGEQWAVAPGIRRAGTPSEPPMIQVAHVALNATTTVDFILGARTATTARLVGTVTTADGKPVAGRGVSVTRKGLAPGQPGADFKATNSDASGAYRLEGLKPGLYEVYQSLGAGEVVGYFGEVEIPAQPECRFDIRFEDTEIAGSISENERGAPLTKSFVMVDRIDAENPNGRFVGYLFTDAEGRYSLRYLPFGVYRVTAFATAANYGYESSEPLTIDREHARAAADLKLSPGAHVRVKVVDESGAPIEGAWVDFENASGRTMVFEQFPRTDATGRYLARGVKPGRWIVHVKKDGLVPSTAEVQPLAGEEPAVTITLRKSDNPR